MDRRRFLQLVSAGAGALVLPAWLSRALAQDHPPVAPASTLTLATLSAEYRAAQRLGKPLLVIVAPEGDASLGRSQLAVAFGALVFAGTSEGLSDLALAEVVCARLADVRALVPQTPTAAPGQEFELVLIETDRVPAIARAIDVGLVAPLAPPGRHRQPDLGRTEQERVEAIFDFQIASLAGAIHDALAPTPAALAARAATARARLDAATLALVDRAAQGGAPLDGLTADRAAAVVALAAATASPANSATLRDALVKGAAMRLRESDVPGSVWGVAEGCGPCGMGYLSPRGAHFLHFFAEPGYRSMF